MIAPAFVLQIKQLPAAAAFASAVGMWATRLRCPSEAAYPQSSPPRSYHELRRQADLFIDLMDLKSKFGRDPSDRPPPRAPRHVPQFLQGQKHSLIDDEEIDVDGR